MFTVRLSGIFSCNTESTFASESSERRTDIAVTFIEDVRIFTKFRDVLERYTS